MPTRKRGSAVPQESRRGEQGTSGTGRPRDMERLWSNFQSSVALHSLDRPGAGRGRAQQLHTPRAGCGSALPAGPGSGSPARHRHPAHLCTASPVSSPLRQRLRHLIALSTTKAALNTGVLSPEYLGTSCWFSKLPSAPASSAWGILGLDVTQSQCLVLKCWQCSTSCLY